MKFTVDEVVKYMEVFCKVEKSINDFMFVAGSSLKNKSHVLVEARKFLEVIKEYNNLPEELRNELEKEKNIREVEKKAHEVLEKFG